MYTGFIRNADSRPETPWGARPAEMPVKLWFTGQAEGLGGQPVRVWPREKPPALTGSRLITLLKSSGLHVSATSTRTHRLHRLCNYGKLHNKHEVPFWSPHWGPGMCMWAWEASTRLAEGRAKRFIELKRPRFKRGLHQTSLFGCIFFAPATVWGLESKSPPPPPRDHALMPWPQMCHFPARRGEIKRNQVFRTLLLKKIIVLRGLEPHFQVRRSC